MAEESNTLNMSNKKIDIFFHIKYFSCPDDHHALKIKDENTIVCSYCQGSFLLKKDNLIDIRPLEPSKIKRLAGNGYRDIFSETILLNDQRSGWGCLANAHAGHRAAIKYERIKILELIKKKCADPNLLIDVSGGVGNYSLFFAPEFRSVIHCELHAPSIVTAMRTASDLDKVNINFLRSDYLSLPLSEEIADVVICTDTLERGQEHEERLLNQIRKVLKPDGIAIVDFHVNRLLRRLNQSSQVKAYNVSDIEELIYNSGFLIDERMEICHIFSKLVPFEGCYTVLDALFKMLVLGGRLLLVLRKS